MSASAGSARWQAPLMGLLLLGWVLSAHLASLGIGPADLHAVVAVVPLGLALLLLAWQWPLPRWARSAAVVGVVVLTGALLLRHWHWLRGNLAWLYYLQHLGAHLALAHWFGRSLLPGHEPVVTGMARLIFGHGISPRKQRYTRGVTWAWTVFFVVNALVSTLLFAWAPTEVWSVHANLLTGPLVGLMFLVEMGVRQRALPPEDRPSLQAIVRAYRERGRLGQQPAPHDVPRS